jgi:dihydroxyacid dehydratase/phosphogluconate dehydratase
VSTGACIGHIGPEALAGGPLGKLRDGDRICIVIDRSAMTGSVDFTGENDRTFSSEEGARILAARAMRDDLVPHAALPDDTRLWAELQSLSGGAWAGCVYDTEKIIARLRG